MAETKILQLPAEMDVRIVRGDDFTLDIALTDDAGAAIDITGFTFAAQVRAEADSPYELATWTVGDRDDAAGTFTLTLAAADTAVLPEVSVSDLQGTDAGGKKRTYLSINLVCLKDVTR